MVIEQSGVKFGLKFQNRTSTQREFDLKSQVFIKSFLFIKVFVKSILKLYNLIAYIQELKDFGQYQTMAFLFSCDWLVQRNLKI